MSSPTLLAVPRLPQGSILACVHAASQTGRGGTYSVKMVQVVLVAKMCISFRTSRAELDPEVAMPWVRESLTSDSSTLPRRSGSMESQRTSISSSRRLVTPRRSSALRNSLRLMSWRGDTIDRQTCLVDGFSRAGAARRSL